MSSDPLMAQHRGGNGYVPMDLYLEDRKETREALREIAADVRALRDESNRDQGQEAAETVAEAVREKAVLSRQDKVWGLIMLVVSVVGAGMLAHFGWG
jgi:hypothetical protein